MYLVKLNYYKESGKWYGEGEFKSGFQGVWEIFEEVQKLLDIKTLPGLVHGHSPYYVTVEIPSHPNNHPHLCIPSEFSR